VHNEKPEKSDINDHKDWPTGIMQKNKQKTTKNFCC